ncbi:MAG: hypothetical protein LBV52_05625 [Spirochaetaceae bacterium]|jgi:hypothetical protein|nr:hypothetical protein [Spirochaetaceae bacterium]
MPSFKSKYFSNIFSPAGICLLYPLVSGIIIIIFRLIFPRNDGVLLDCFKTGSALTNGFIDFCLLFPALFMTALIIPFGKKPQEKIKYGRFSSELMNFFKPSIISSIIAVLVYGILFLALRPLASDYQVDIKVKSQLYRISKEKCIQFAERELWDEAANFMAICEGIWNSSPELTDIREQIIISLEKKMYGRVPKKQIAVVDYLPGQIHPVDAREALNFAQKAYDEGKYYDAHWLANLAKRLAKDGQIEQTQAERLSSVAWNAISHLEPAQEELDRFSIYQQKRNGYEAMNSEDWTRAYYIFMSLSKEAPDDPDIQKFLLMSAEGINRSAFFFDEMESHTGEQLVNAVFSIPTAENRGRIVLRFAALTSTADFCYGKGLELAAFDELHKPLFRVEAQYVKILPVSLGSSAKTEIYLRAIDRYDESKHWDPVWSENKNPDYQILLDIPFDDFLLASVAGGNYSDFYLKDLWNSANSLDRFGYVPQVFQGEILRSVMEPMLFLPLTMFTIIIGWTLRTRKRARYSFYPMFLILPLVLNVFIDIVRQVSYEIEMFTILSFGFTAAITMCVAGAAVLFIIMLLLLASQHG